MKTQTTAQILKQAYKLFKNGKNWIRGDYAHDAKGNEIGSESPYAVKFCSVGAIEHLQLPASASSAENSAFRILEDHLPEDWTEITDFNDADGWPPVKALWIKAIQTAEKLEKKRLDGKGKRK